jgi:hypothetical protein
LLFSRLVFNVLCSNRDDHARNQCTPRRLPAHSVGHGFAPLANNSAARGGVLRRWFVSRTDAGSSRAATQGQR